MTTKNDMQNPRGTDYEHWKQPPASPQPQREQPVDGADLKAIENFIYSTMNHTREWELAENAYQRILTARSRPHTPAPDTMTISVKEFEQYIKDKQEQAARTATLAAYERFMQAIEYRFDDTNNGRGVVGVIRGIKESLRTAHRR
jgi:hypothetical protein